jgi:hypothetical protein
MEQLIKSSVINSIVFSTYDKMGPQPTYMFPPPFKNDGSLITNADENASGETKPGYRDYMHISIKTLSLLIGDGTIFNDLNVSDFQHFGIIPFPDFNSTALTFFHFIASKSNELPLATAFSVLVEEEKRSFLYSNIDRLKIIIQDFFKDFDPLIADEILPQEEIEDHFKKLITRIIDIEKTPSTPFSSHRRMKVLFAGLDNSGKSSFLLSVDRRFSKIIGLKPTLGAKVSSIDALGATFFLWDLGGQEVSRKRYIDKAHIYLYEAELLFYFIDLSSPERFDESLAYLQSIKNVLNRFNQTTHIVHIFSKADPDVVESKQVQSDINYLNIKLSQLNENRKVEFYTTSIFQLYTILRAFSSGIAKLSPNRELIEHNLHNFALESRVFLSLILSNDGLVLAEYNTPDALRLTDIKDNEEMVNVFKLTAPQFAMLYKIFSHYKTNPYDEAIFKVAKSLILFKPIKIDSVDLFFLFLIDNENKKEKINELLPTFLDSIRDLLTRYIA